MSAFDRNTRRGLNTCHSLPDVVNEGTRRPQITVRGHAGLSFTEDKEQSVLTETSSSFLAI